MKNFKLFLLLAVMSFIPWGLILKVTEDVGIQMIGLTIQIVGLSVLVIARKAIF